MSAKDFSFWLKDFWSEFRREKSGLVGLAILAISLIIVAFEGLILPYKSANTEWRNISYWQDNPKSAPPAWVNWFSSEKGAVSIRDENPKTSEELGDGISTVTNVFSYDYQYDKAPFDVIFHATLSGTAQLQISVTRPDGKTIELAQRVEQDLLNNDVRFSLENDTRDALYEFLKANLTETAMGMIQVEETRPTDIVFCKAEESMFQAMTPLKGKYLFTLTATLIGDSKIEKSYMTTSGRVSGIFGTDAGGRDLFSGLVAGLKWALIIGFFTSLVSVLLGVLYGITSAYFGGSVDSVMQFIYQIFVGIPVLPVLIVLSAVFKPSIMVLIPIMIIFFWTGPVMTVRSMAFQIKEETYIEAARALGAGHGRIVFKHMLPILIPYSFANMALSVPGAILYEASVSLLGLGDPTVVTWGSILYDAMQGSAILSGIWWWIVPPGLLIAIMGMTFAFLGFAMDKILHPKLRTR